MDKPHPRTVQRRIARGWDPELAATTPPATRAQSGRMGARMSSWSRQPAIPKRRA